MYVCISWHSVGFWDKGISIHVIIKSVRVVGNQGANYTITLCTWRKMYIL